MSCLKKVFLFLFVLVAFGVKAENLVYFSPKGNCEKMIVNRINSAEKKNSENCIFFDDEDGTVSKYLKRFEYLWQINTKYKAEDWIEKHF